MAMRPAEGECRHGFGHVISAAQQQDMALKVSQSQTVQLAKAPSENYGGSHPGSGPLPTCSHRRLWAARSPRAPPSGPPGRSTSEGLVPGMG